MAKQIKTNQLPLQTDLTNAKVIGLDKDGKDVQMPLASIIRSEKGIALPATVPSGTRFAGETFIVDTASYGSTFTGFGNINVPIKVGSQYVSNARFVYNSGSWGLQKELVDAPSLTDYVSKDFSDFGGRYATIAEANTPITSIVVNGKNNRDGKKVDIGTLGSYITHAWKGGFANANLVPLTTYIATRNLYDKTKNIADKVVGSSGAIVANTGDTIADYIPVLPNTTYTLSGRGALGSNGVSFSNSSKVVLSGLSPSIANGTVTFTTPDLCYYVQFTTKRISVSSYDTIQLVLGDKELAYQPFSLIKESYGSKLLADYILSSEYGIVSIEEYIKKHEGSVKKTYPIGKNLYDYTKVTNGMYIMADGTLGVEANSKTAPLIPISPKSTYTLSGFANKNTLVVAYYNELGAYISQFSIAGGSISSLMTTPDTAVNIRFMVRSSDATETTDITLIQFEKGVKTSFEAYSAIELNVTENASKLLADAKSYGAITDPKHVVTKEYLEGYSTGLTTKGVNMIIFGDSIWTILGGENSPSRHLPLYLESANIYNYAISGKSYRDDGGQLASAIAAASPNINIVLSVLGTNDWPTVLGDYATAMAKTTIESLDRTKLYEAIRYYYWKIRIEWPTAVCYAATPIQTSNASMASTSTQVDTAIKTMAAKYGFIVIDLRAESGILSQFESDGANGRDLWDGVHPYPTSNSTGDIKMAKCVAAKIRSTYIK